MIRSIYCFALAVLVAVVVQAEPPCWQFASTPVLGWNSWDCFGTTINEQQSKEQADAMAKFLKPSGYNLFTVDIQWYEANTAGHDYKDGAPVTLDEYSRLVPAPEKFPSAANGAGFKPLADYVHSKGLKFGIHLMRGIAKQAVRANSSILGTTARAPDIADTNSTCPWNPDMFGVDMSKTGAQAYYDSLLKLYAAWGVDFIKVDDLSSLYHTAEIEAIRQAIDKTGRAIIFSTSPGPTPVEQGDHIMRHANQWRISNDFWDNWKSLYEQIKRLDDWTTYRGPGHFPDADMLPFGIIEFKRATHFTKEEQFFCMSLWSVARSPLILGADLTKLDDFTLNLLTNREVLAINQASTGNRQLSRNNDLVVWTADVPKSKDKYVGFFNAQSNDSPFDFSKANYTSPVLRGSGGQSVNISVPITNARKLVLAVGDGGDNNFYDHAAWIEPTLSGSKGTLKLTDLKWTSVTAGWGEVRVNRSVDDQPLMLDKAPVNGIGTHSISIIEYDLPEGYDNFRARGMITPVGSNTASLQFLVLVDPEKHLAPEKSPVSVSFADLGITGTAKARDLWKRKDLGAFTNQFSREIPLHGTGLYRVSPAN